MSEDSARRARFHGRVERAEPTPCGVAGCASAAEFRAPRSNRVPGPVGGWQWLCLDHVRAFNNSYNYFDGLTPEEIAAAQSPLAGWERAAHDPDQRMADPLGVMGARFASASRAGPANAAGTVRSAADLSALATLGLDANAVTADIRRAYKRLARRFHPDSNNGDRRYEHRLRAVIDAYAHLRNADRR